MSKYCANCKQQVTPTKKFNWLAFFLLFGVLYLPIYFLKSKRCQMCNDKNWAKSPVAG